MPKLVCVECEKEYKPHRNGVYLVEMFNTPPQPYKVWHSDMWQCRNCGNRVISGFAEKPLKEHFQNGFDEWFDDLVKSDAIVIYSYE